MTVGIAALSNADTGFPRVFCASDQMLSTGHIQFESRNSKAVLLTSSIVLLIAGSVAWHTPVERRVRELLANLIESEPEKWRRVEEVAELYRTEWLNVRASMIEYEVLSPFNLTLSSLLENQGRFTYDFFANLQRRIEFAAQQYDSQFAAIIAGVDGTHEKVSAHIFSVEGSTLTCHDRLGYAAIGTGAAQALSHFMTKHHTPHATVEEALFTTYVSKRLAEEAPGVGKTSDFIVVGPRLGSAAHIREDVIAAVQNAYSERERALAKAEEFAMSTLSGELEKVFSPQQSQQVDARNTEPPDQPPQAP